MRLRMSSNEKQREKKCTGLKGSSAKKGEMVSAGQTFDFVVMENTTD